MARAADFTAGSFAQALLNTKHGPARETLILEAFLNPANVVDWGWTEVHVPVAGHDVTFSVMNDVLSIGSTSAPFRVPMNPRTAQLIADDMGAMLPTARMTDYFSAAAVIRLEPVPIGALRGPNGEKWQAGTNDQHEAPAYVSSNAKIEQQRQGRMGLMAGQKKMVVVSNKLTASQVCIYGWPQLSTAGVKDGKLIGSAGFACAVLRTPSTNLCMIQGEYTGHEWSYADYSHGIQLVSQLAKVDGTPTDISTILADTTLSHALNEGGPLKVMRQPGTGSVQACVVGGANALCYKPDPTVQPENDNTGIKLLAAAGAAAAGWYGYRWWRRRR